MNPVIDLMITGLNCVKFETIFSRLKQNSCHAVYCISVLTLFLSTGCERIGFQKVNGKWAYVTSTAGSGRTVNTLSEDVDSFTVLGRNFAKDRKRVFFQRFTIKEADPDSFELLDKLNYAKDKNHVYIMNYVIENADPKTFKVLEAPYGRDANNAYCGSIKMSVKNLDNFEPVKCFSANRTCYNHEYFVDEFGEEFDFLEVSQKHPVVVGAGWARDGTFYYFGPAKVKNADYESFRVVDRFSGRDKNRIFEGISQK